MLVLWGPERLLSLDSKIKRNMHLITLAVSSYTGQELSPEVLIALPWPSLVFPAANLAASRGKLFESMPLTVIPTRSQSLPSAVSQPDSRLAIGLIVQRCSVCIAALNVANLPPPNTRAQALLRAHLSGCELWKDVPLRQRSSVPSRGRRWRPSPTL